MAKPKKSLFVASNKRLGILILSGLVVIGIAVAMIAVSQVQTSTNTRAGGGTCKSEGGTFFSKTCAALTNMGRERFTSLLQYDGNEKYCCIRRALDQKIGKSCDQLKGNLYSSCAAKSKPAAPLIRATDISGAFANNENDKQCCIAAIANTFDCDAVRSIVKSVDQINHRCVWYSGKAESAFSSSVNDCSTRILEQCNNCVVGDNVGKCKD